ncbi:MAG TPA: hypothetical protein VII06_23700 [Chloroflexota bacterium]|jgi:hypothetical protein
MGLDVYVGTLTRYYRRDWSTVVQQWGAAHGVPVQVVRPNEGTSHADPAHANGGGPATGQGVLGRLGQRVRAAGTRVLGRRRPPSPEPVTDSEMIRQAVLGWRNILSSNLGDALRYPLDWPEADAMPYFTDKPAWDGYASLALLAAYDEQSVAPRPSEVTSSWADDPVWQEATRDNFAHTRYAQILAPELWLPGEFDFVFQAKSIAGEDVWVGSSNALLSQLRQLDARTFQRPPEEVTASVVDPEDLSASAIEPVDLEKLARESAQEPAMRAPFDQAARFGLAMFLHLAEKSVAYGLPMKLDY